MVILVFIAVFYTTPWDSFIIKNGIWFYDQNKIIGTILRIPIEEYFFMIIQTLIASMLYCINQKNLKTIFFLFPLDILFCFPFCFYVVFR